MNKYVSAIFLLFSIISIQAQSGLNINKGTQVNNRGFLTIGKENGVHIAISDYIIQRKLGIDYGSLFLNYYGGDLWLGNKGLVYDQSEHSIGIGTDKPQIRLHVNQGGFDLPGGVFIPHTIAGFMNTYASAYISLMTQSDYESGLIFGDESSGAQGGVIYNNPATPDGLQLRTNGNTTRMSINNLGDVGIGLLNPSSPLHIKCRNSSEYGIKMERYNSTDNWEMSVLGGDFIWFLNDFAVALIAPNGTYMASDRRLKQKIKPYKEVLPLLSTLNVATYEFKDLSEGYGSSLGLIGQEVSNVFPEIVRLSPNRDGEMYYSLDYSKIGVIAIKAVQELQTTLVEKEAEQAQLLAVIKNLYEQNEELVQRIEALEIMVKNLGKE